MANKKEDTGSYEPIIKNVDVEHTDWILGKGQVLVRCYDRWDIWDRKKAKAFFRRAMLSCEGCERDRYINIWAGLDEFPKMNVFNDEGEAWHV